MSGRLGAGVLAAALLLALAGRPGSARAGGGGGGGGAGASAGGGSGGGPAVAKVLRKQQCTSCHLDDSPEAYLFASFDTFRRSPPPPPAGCARCHVNNWLAASEPAPAGWLPLSDDVLARVRGFHAYVQAPSLAFAVELPDAAGKPRTLPRFTSCGLERFLASPLPRRAGATQAMFPVEPAPRRALLRALAGTLDPCTPAEGAATIERGRQLFAARACVTCHAGTGVGPRLRLGFPLLARRYFDARVRQGTVGAKAPLWQRRWQAVKGQIVATFAGAVAMPAHADVTDGDLDALYAYVSSDRSDVPVVPAAPPAGARVQVTDAIRLSLFREVQKRVFDTSCRHCHGADRRDQSIIQRVFGVVPGAAPVGLPTSRIATPVGDAELRAVLEPGPGCSDSRLIARLKARAREWSGHARAAGVPRGMPLTLPPVANDAIRLVEAWTAAGCPSDAGDLCNACGGSSH